MILDNVEQNQLNYYKNMLSIIGSLSKLFSESDIPYLNYRITENLFCKAFNAKNLSRSDVSADASIDQIGIGIKTFLYGNGKTWQKIAEFNKHSNLFRNLDGKNKILKIAELRNERINATKRIHNLNEMFYHCITRKKSKILVFESQLDLVNLDNIKRVTNNGNVISFQDENNEYSFNISKSTLYKRFLTKNVALDIPVTIIEDPFKAIEEGFYSVHDELEEKDEEHEFVILPLYSDRGEKHVPEKSGLNQWNAGGRARNHNEIYIPIPKWIHNKFPGFFPSRDNSFTLSLPNGNELNASVCQDNSKALMSNPNSALGEWLLRDVLNLREGQLLTYEMLQRIGLDSIYIEKIDDKHYSIDFRPSDTYEKFLIEHA